MSEKWSNSKKNVQENKKCASIAQYGIELPCLPYIALCGLVWPYVAVCGLVWPYVALYGLISPYVASCGFDVAMHG